MRLVALPLALFSLFITAAQAQSLTIDQAQVRAVPPGSPTTVAFMNLTNPGEMDLALLGGSSPLAGNLELHNHVMVDGVMQMRQVEAIPVPAGETVRLAPGGWHMMLFELARIPREGEHVELTLTLDNGETLSVEAPVRRVQPMEMQGEGQHGSH
ncbi:copper chaperone PCu(A)C [Halomonas daqiaonensis]|uniref:Copper(I)-binding protein n=1 Tax=Halomonas daqiaonensis TaxID=650850 RepID=A0A1H7M728_9GAMM|nr:copper chaperone PCu(A)C [Halomonas daqiaonensis]SEL07004.1 hypothetical protein SAMN04488129_106155 [Halomonas daqiaonensis]